MLENYVTYATLPRIRRDGRLWLVLAITEHERRNSYTLDCVALEGDDISPMRQDFTAGKVEVGKLKDTAVELRVTI